MIFRLIYMYMKIWFNMIVRIFYLLVSVLFIMFLIFLLFFLNFYLLLNWLGRCFLLCGFWLILGLLVLDIFIWIFILDCVDCFIWILWSLLVFKEYIYGCEIFFIMIFVLMKLLFILIFSNLWSLIKKRLWILLDIGCFVGDL